MLTPPPLLRSYGRKRGRKLKPLRSGLLQSLLPELRIDLNAPPPQNLNALFAAEVKEIWLEIGFGGGEHLIEQALRNPQAGLIGAEPFINGVAKLLPQIEALKLGNIRILDDDARPLIGWLPARCLSRVFILFPDPWPKRRHQERRIVNPQLIADLSRVMAPGASLRIASDIEDYIDWACSAIAAADGFAQSGRDFLSRPADWARTRYEAKAITAGRICRYLEFTRL